MEVRAISTVGFGYWRPCGRGKSKDLAGLVSIPLWCCADVVQFLGQVAHAACPASKGRVD